MCIYCHSRSRWWNHKWSYQLTPMHSCRTTQCMQTLVQHTHTCTLRPLTTYMFPFLSSLILEFITEKTHPCFLLFKPDVSSSFLPVFCFSPLCGPLLFIVMWSGELTGFFRVMCVRVCVCPHTKPCIFSPFFSKCRLESSRHTNTATNWLAGFKVFTTTTLLLLCVYTVQLI